jgi:hypothetical protein
MKRTAASVLIASSVLLLSLSTRAKNADDATEIMSPAFRNAETAQSLVGKYAEGSVARQQLVRTLASHYFSKGDLKKAEDVLKKNKNDKLYWGRLSYQAGDYKTAAKNFESISKDSPDFIRGLEELAWARLMMGDLGALRGLLAHLNSELVPLEERLEGRVLSAIGYLKNCQYDDVKREIELFQKEMLPLVKRLDSADRKTKEASAIRSDFYTRQAAQIVESAGTGAKLNQAKKILAQENTRSWKNLKELSAEAILKMRFVRMELLSQLQMLEKAKTKQDILAKNNQVADAGSGQEALAKAGSGKMVFPVKGDVWVDELFNVRALTATECEALQQ